MNNKSSHLKKKEKKRKKIQQMLAFLQIFKCVLSAQILYYSNTVNVCHFCHWHGS